jgi:chromosome segregation ATPase
MMQAWRSSRLGVFRVCVARHRSHPHTTPCAGTTGQSTIRAAGGERGYALVRAASNEEQVKAAAAAVEAAKAKHADARRRLGDAQAELAGVKKQADALTGAWKKAEAEAAKAAKDAAAAEGAPRPEVEDDDAEAERRAELDAAVGTAAAHVNTAKAARDKAAAAAAELTPQLSAATAEMARLKKAIDSDPDVADRREEESAALSTLKALNGKMVSLQGIQANKDGEYEAAKKAAIDAAAKMESLKEQVTAATGRDGPRPGQERLTVEQVSAWRVKRERGGDFSWVVAVAPSCAFI